MACGGKRTTGAATKAAPLLRRHKLVRPHHRHLRAAEEFKQHLNPVVRRDAGDHGEDIAPGFVRQPDMIAGLPSADFIGAGFSSNSAAFSRRRSSSIISGSSVAG